MSEQSTSRTGRAAAFGARPGAQAGPEAPDSGVRPDGGARSGARGAGPRKPLSRGVIFAALSAACLLIAVGYIAWAARRHQAALSDASAVVVPLAPGGMENIPALQKQPHLVFQHVARDDNYAQIALAPLDAPDSPRTITPLACERVYFAAGQGLCLMPERGLVTTYYAYTFGPDFQPRQKITLTGRISRARVSPDGRYGAATVFVSGHSYADGAFSTQTTLIDMATSTTIGELEQFTVSRNGERFHSADFNFWGVTFARDSNRFYATLRTNGQTYLVEGDVAGRSMRVLHENVECPSLSPDNTRVAFKKRIEVGPQAEWRLHILDLATMTETPLAESKSVDDQVEWLDDRNVLYGMPTGLAADVWTVPADGTGQPRKLVSQALSPAVVR